MIDQFIKPDSWTARDLYAAFALAGMYANSRSQKWTHSEIALDALTLAEIMMRLRQKH